MAELPFGLPAEESAASAIATCVFMAPSLSRIFSCLPVN